MAATPRSSFVFLIGVISSIASTSGPLRGGLGAPPIPLSRFAHQGPHSEISSLMAAPPSSP
eukprot:5826460-Pyramimonas_sp.AAC.1